MDALVGGTAPAAAPGRRPGLAELYGQVDWSVRALYDGALGWFDGRAERLYPSVDAREIELMGGAAAVTATARAALARGTRGSQRTSSSACAATPSRRRRQSSTPCGRRPSGRWPPGWPTATGARTCSPRPGDRGGPRRPGRRGLR
ncbi:MAG: alkyl sulfatase dimerization domain-containing protein [bacterium]